MILKNEVIRNKTFSAFSDIKILMEESKQKLLNRILLYSCRAFDWLVDGRNQTGSYAENQVWMFRQVSIKISFWNFGTIRILMQERKPTTFNLIDLLQLHKKNQWDPHATNQTWSFAENWAWISLISFWNFQTIRFLLPEKNFDNFYLKDCQESKISDWDLDGREQASTNIETWIWNWRWFKTKNLQSASGHLDFDARIKLKTFSIESSSTTVDFPIDTLFGETKP